MWLQATCVQKAAIGQALATAYNEVEERRGI